MASTTELSRYLFTRLKQLGIETIHGLPGDYNLTLLDYVEPSGLKWSGNCNELNAGYAADGYARFNGIGAIVTTFGVGELSAINAIAGSYAELVPVVHIVGTPSRSDQTRRALVHHTFADGNFDRFSQIYSHVTVAQASLWDTRTSPAQIDAVLEQCLLQSRPVYIQVPADMVAAQVSTSRLATPISVPPPVEPTHGEAVLSRLLARITASRKPAILVDGESKSMRIADELDRLIKATQWPTWMTAFGKGLLDESHPNLRGIYTGSFGDPKDKEYLESCDLILSFGPHHTSTNSFFWTTIPNPKVTIAFAPTTVRIDGETFQDLTAKQVLSKLLGQLDSSKLVQAPFPLEPKAENSQREVNHQALEAEKGAITQKRFYATLQHLINPGDIVLGETGTAAYGVRNFHLPPHCKFFNPATWLSIGYMLPAALGAGLAQREQILKGDFHGIKHARTMLFIGDGSVQISVQEISTIIREKLDMIIFILNNEGYTIERCIHGRNQGYNDIAPWRYLQAPSLFGGDDGDGEHATYTFQVKDWSDLNKTINDPRLTTSKGLKIVEVFMDRLDAPAGLLPDLLEKQLKREGK